MIFERTTRFGFVFNVLLCNHSNIKLSVLSNGGVEHVNTLSNVSSKKLLQGSFIFC